MIDHKYLDFLSKTIERNLEYYVPHDSVEREFLQTLESRYTGYIVGGFVRDSIEENTPRDIDIIVHCPAESLDTLIHESHVPWTANSNGGFKIFGSLTAIDIWAMETHPYYRSGYFHNESDLHKSLFITTDSLVYNLRTKEVFIDQYLEAKQQNLLDFADRDSRYQNATQQSPANILRILSSTKRYELQLSKPLKTFVAQFVQTNSHPVASIDNEQIRHYGRRRFQPWEIQSFLEQQEL